MFYSGKNGGEYSYLWVFHWNTVFSQSALALFSVEPQQEWPLASIPQGGLMEGQGKGSFSLSSFLGYLFSKTLYNVFQN